MISLHPSCWLNHHVPIRKDVKWNGHSYVGVCTHCGAPIRRRAHNNWVRSDPPATPPPPQDD